MALDDFDFSSSALIRKAESAGRIPPPVAPVMQPPRPKLDQNEIFAAQSIYQPVGPSGQIPVAPFSPKQGGWK